MRSPPHSDSSSSAYLIHSEEDVWGSASVIRVERMWCCTWSESPWDKASPRGMRLGWKARGGRRVGGGSDASDKGRSASWGRCWR